MPRACSASAKARQVSIGPPRSRHLPNDGPQVCMFNYECARRQGEVVGTCMDGFLFGACCRLPTGTEVGPSATSGATEAAEDDLASTELVGTITNHSQRFTITNITYYYHLIRFSLLRCIL